jgi:hypothetical protein
MKGVPAAGEFHADRQATLHERHVASGKMAVKIGHEATHFDEIVIALIESILEGHEIRDQHLVHAPDGLEDMQIALVQPAIDRRVLQAHAVGLTRDSGMCILGLRGK